MNDRFKFRLPFYNNNGEFSHFEFILIGESLPAYNAGVMFHRGEYEQCTGLKDKNGNLIYEGDLIKSPNNSYPLEIVRMSNGVYGCKVCKISPVWEMNLYSLINAYDVEVIDNIHNQKEQQ